MEKLYKVFIYSTLFASVYLPKNIFGQTYATPELKFKTEKQDKEKATKLGINQKLVDHAEESQAKKKPFDYSQITGSYRLQKVQAIDHSGKHTFEEMKKFNLEAQGEFDSYERAVNIEKLLFFTVKRKDPTHYRTDNISLEGKYFLIGNCKTCRDNRFEIVEMNPTTLILEIKPQDEGHYFVYRFTFAK